MGITHKDISRFVNSRQMVAVAGILMLVGARIAFQRHDVTYFAGDRGLLFNSANLWIESAWLTMAVSTAVLLAASLAWLVVLQVFNPFRRLSSLPTAFFMVMMVSMPDLVDQLYGGTLLVVAVPCCLALLWFSFGSVHRLRPVFLIFFVLSALSMSDRCFLFYIPAFAVGCLQMKIMCLRTVLACVLGLVTPWWIVLGTGLADFGDIRLPWRVDVSALPGYEDRLSFFLVLASTLVLLVVGWAANFMHVLKLNSNMRAYNGSVSIIALFTLAGMAVDYVNAVTYLPVLMLAAAYEAGYMAAVSKGRRGVVIPVAVVVMYVAFFGLNQFL